MAPRSRAQHSSAQHSSAQHSAAHSRMPRPASCPCRCADDEGLKWKMAQAAEQHRKIYESYNLPYNVEPGSIMDKAMKLWKRKQSRK
jgi:hypothetical protein